MLPPPAPSGLGGGAFGGGYGDGCLPVSPPSPPPSRSTSPTTIAILVVVPIADPRYFLTGDVAEMNSRGTRAARLAADRGAPVAVLGIAAKLRIPARCAILESSWTEGLNTRFKKKR